MPILHAVYSFVMVPLGLLVVIVVFVPLVQGAGGPETIGAVAGIIGAVFGSLVGLAYPIVMLVLLCRSSARASLT